MNKRKCNRVYKKLTKTVNTREGELLPIHAKYKYREEEHKDAPMKAEERMVWYSIESGRGG